MSQVDIIRLGNEALESHVKMSNIEHETMSLEEASYRLECLVDPTLDRSVPQEQLALSYESVVGIGIDNPYHDTSADVVSLEGRLWDTIKKIWQAIKNAAKRFINHMVDYITKYFSGVEKALKEVDKLERVLTNLSKGETQTSDKQVSFGDGQRIGIDGKVDIKALMDRLNKEFNTMANIKKTYMNQYSTLLKDLPAYAVDLVSMSPGERKIPDGTLEKRIEKDNDIIEQLFGEFSNNRELPGGKQFKVVKSTDNKDLVGLHRLEVDDYPRARLFKGKMVDVADIATLTQMLKLAKVHLESIKSEEDELTRLKDMLRGTTDDIDDVLSDREDYVMRTRKDKKLMMEIVDKTRLGYVTRLNRLGMYQYHVMRGVLGYIHVCAKSY